MLTRIPRGVRIESYFANAWARSLCVRGDNLRVKMLDPLSGAGRAQRQRVENQSGVGPSQSVGAAGTRKCSLPNISAMAAAPHGPNTGLHLTVMGE